MNTYLVQKKKHDGTIYTEHGMEIWEETAEGILGQNPVGDRWVKPQQNLTFYQDQPNVLYFPKGQWYNLIYYYDARNNNAETLYINLATPYQIEGDVIGYYDYDIDLILRNHQLVIDDLDEWQSRKGLYPPEVVTQIETTMHDLIRQLVDNTFEPLSVLRNRYRSFLSEFK